MKQYMIPHYYYLIFGWFDQETLFSQMVYSCNDTDKHKFVEIGSWKGRSSCYMGVEILNSKKNIQFDCIDTWLGSDEHRDSKSNHYEPLLETKDGLYDVFIRNIEPIQSVVNPIRMSSIEASKLYEDESLDFVYIDGAHDYDSVYEDIKHWYPKVKNRGYIAGDDFEEDAWPGVYWAIKKYFNNDVNVIRDTTWIKQKNQV